MKLQEKFKKKYKIDAIDFVEKANLKNFGLVKKVGLENVLEDYIKSENLSFKIDDEFNKDLIEAFAEAGERFPDNVKLSFRSNDNFNLEPTPINPSIPKSKGTLENFKDIVGNDELRVKMNGVYVSEDGYLVGTDAHKLIKFKSNEYNKYAGKIINLKTFIASKGKKLDFIDEKYPDYQAVIPRENEEIENLPTYNFYNLAKSTIAIKKLQDSDIFNINFKIKDKIYSFNPIIMLDVLNFALCNGLDTFTFKYSEPNRAALLDFGSKCVGLVMPVYNQNDLTKGTTLMTFEDVINNYRNFKPSTKERPSTKVEVKKQVVKDVPYTKFDGTIKDTTYIPRRDISYVVLKNGEQLSSSEIADGVYKINKKMATGGGVGKVRTKTNDKIIADDLIKYADLQGISAFYKKIGSYYVITLGRPLELRDSMNGKIKSLLFTKMETGGGVTNEIAEIKAKIEKAKNNTIMPENLKKQYIEKYEKQLSGLILKQGTKEDVKDFLEVPKGKTPKIVKVEPKGKVKLKEILIHWAEGDNSKYDEFPKKYKTWESANKAIIPVYEDYAEEGGGGYNKVKFTVTFEDGENYDGRLDVSTKEDNPTKTHNVIGQHIKDYLDYQLSEKSRTSETAKKEILEWLEKYDLGLEKSKVAPKKEKVKILGTEVTVGTKEYKKLLAQKKNFDDLAKSEIEQTSKNSKKYDYIPQKDIKEIKATQGTVENKDILDGAYVKKGWKHKK